MRVLSLLALLVLTASVAGHALAQAQEGHPQALEEEEEEESALLQTAGARADRVTELPGYQGPPVDFLQFSGYVGVNDAGLLQEEEEEEEEGGKKGEVQGARYLHYWFTAASGGGEEEGEDEKPLVLWLNGGPGCSSLLGLLTENGPFRVQDDGISLKRNPYAWNRVANVIYLETPAPVGYSYGGNGTSGDDETAHDNYYFLQGFLERFPAFKDRPFYITGESYAGQYVPQLAYTIVQENERGGNPHINIKGWLVGNPSGLSTSDFRYGYYGFLEGHGILSTDEFNALYAVCETSLSTYDPDACSNLENILYNSNIYMIDPYNVLGPCLGDGPDQNPGCFTHRQLQSTIHRLGRDETEMVTLPNGGSQTFVPCEDTFPETNYLNLDEVREALHVSVPPAFEWEACSSELQTYNIKGGTPDIYKELNGVLQIGVYSGDIDSCVPMTYTREAIRELDFPVSKDYRRWMYDDVDNGEQIAGWTISYDKTMTYYTVRGAGHMVPEDKPQPALQMLERFLRGDD